MQDFDFECRCDCENHKRFPNILSFTGAFLLVPSVMLGFNGEYFLASLSVLAALMSVLYHSFHMPILKIVDVFVAYSLGFTGTIALIESLIEKPSMTALLGLLQVLMIISINNCNCFRTGEKTRLEFHVILHILSISSLTCLSLCTKNDFFLAQNFSFYAKAAMSDIKVIHISQFSPTNLVPSAPKRNQNGGLRIDLDYKDPVLNGSHYLVQTPKLRLPFGMQQYGGEEKDDKSKSYSLSLSLDNYRDLSSHENEFLKGIKAIDEHIKSLAIENSQAWFRKSMKKEVIEELFSSSIRETNDWPPTFKAKLPYYNGKFNCDFYDQSRKKCLVDNITQNCHIIGLVNVTSLWFINNRFGVTWQLKQLQVFQPPKYDTFLITGTDHEDEEKSNDSGRSRSRSPRGCAAMPED